MVIEGRYGIRITSVGWAYSKNGPIVGPKEVLEEIVESLKKEPIPQDDFVLYEVVPFVEIEK
jgi:hypothetical protein